MTSLEELPLRPELRGRSAYGAPQLTVAHQLNTNENPHPLPDGLLADLGTALAEASRGLNRYPDRNAVALRTDLATYLTRTSGEQVGVDQVWAANGSNEVLQQVLQAFGGAGRTALGFTPSYSMYPVYCAGTGTGWVDGHRRADFTIDVDAATAQVREVGPAGRRWASRRPTRCTRSSAPAPAPAGWTGTAAPTSPSTSARPPRRCGRCSRTSSS